MEMTQVLVVGKKKLSLFFDNNQSENLISRIFQNTTAPSRYSSFLSLNDTVAIAQNEGICVT